MEKIVAEKTLDGSLLSKFIEPRYFMMFAAFGLYWDSYSCLLAGSGFLQATYKIGDAVPLGNIYILVATFSLLASVISPAAFWFFNNIVWDLRDAIPERIWPDRSTSKFASVFEQYVSTSELKLWAIKSNNSHAMALAKEEESLQADARKNRPQPFLLALCVGVNYFLINDGLLTLVQKALSDRAQGYFAYCVIFFIGFLMYAALTGFRERGGYVHLPGLKDLVIGSKTKATDYLR